MDNLEQAIERHHLQPHPEGGWYREIYRSQLRIQRADGSERTGLTAILFALGAQQPSRWHQVRGSDEAWSYVDGGPLELNCLHPSGGPAQLGVLGPEQPLIVIPADHWQAARCLGDWTLVSCCVGPGFDFADFSLLADLPKQAHPAGANPALI